MSPINRGTAFLPTAAGPRRRVMAAIWVCIMLLLVGGVAGAATVGDSGSSGARVTQTAAAPTTTPAPAASNPAAAGAPAPAAATARTTVAPRQAGSAKSASGPSSPAPAASASAAASPAPEDLGPASDPGPVTVTRPGTYKERLTTTSDTSSSTQEITTKVENENQAGGITNQKVTTSSDKGSLTSEVSWRPDSLMLLSNTFGAGQSTFVCGWTPPIKLLAIPMAIGTAWTSDSQCSMSAYGQTETVHETMQAKVVRLERIRAAGQVVDCWVIERTLHIEGTGAFGFTSDTTSTEWFSPKHARNARSTADTKNSGTYNGQTNSSQSKSTTEALTLDPQ